MCQSLIRVAGPGLPLPGRTAASRCRCAGQASSGCAARAARAAALWGGAAGAVGYVPAPLDTVRLGPGRDGDVVFRLARRPVTLDTVIVLGEQVPFLSEAI